MLQILKSRSLVKKSELAELLETNPRNIIELKRELETAGYDIETVSGKNGGYRLRDEGLLTTPDLTPAETEALQEVLLYLRSSDITLRKDAESALEKVLSVTLNEHDSDDIYSSGTRLAISQKELQKRYEKILAALHLRHRLIISYRPSNRKVEKIVMHPYGMFVYRGMWYLVGYSEKRKREATLKLNRIEEIEEMEVSYSIPDDFSIRRYASSYGISIHGDNHLKCQIRGRYYISEYIYGENQKITPLSDDLILFEADFPNEMTLKSFVMNLGADCEVTEPQWLIGFLKEESEKIAKMY